MQKVLNLQYNDEKPNILIPSTRKVFSYIFNVLNLDASCFVGKEFWSFDAVQSGSF